MCKCYLFKTTGIKLLDSNFNMSDNNEYTIVGFTGICNMFMLMSLMLMQEGKKLYKVIVTCVIIVFECLFMVSRGQIIKVSAFLLMYFLLNQSFINTIGNRVINIFTKKNKLIIGISFLIIIIVFSYMGQYRQAVRSNGIYNIMNVTQLKINSVPLAWLYSYYPLNFEVVRLYYQEPMKTLGYPSTILMPIIRLVLNDSETYLKMFTSTSKLHINGFNAATFLSRYIMDFGYFYFLELIMLGIYIGFIEKMAIYNKCKGVYAFILSLMLLYAFGEYSMVAYYVVAILFTIFLYSFIIKEENDG